MLQRVRNLIDPRARLDRLPGLVAPGEQGDTGTQAPMGQRGGVRVRDVVFNLPLVFGGLIVLGLFLLVLFGPLLAPTNPYIAGQHIVPHFDPEAQQWVSPPLDPSPAYPFGTDQWGNDIFSMLLYGARNTLIACAFITMVRILLGLALGALAGWNAGSLTDHLIMGTTGVLASVPMLISAMLVVYSLDIRRGLPVFIAALAFIGWTEIAQYIRSEFLVLRKMPFIEGANAVGTGSFAIAVRHILPNLLPQLLVISFLELGAVLMLLGELSFVGVYIGGGSHIALGDEISGGVFRVYDVPEWGAMLAEGQRWLRAKPFIVFPPAMAFFISVVGLNAFGEGLRQLIEKYHISTNFLLRKRMAFVIAGLSIATVFIINNTGPAPWFARLARAFDGETAYAHTEKLVSMQGRGAGQQGAAEAAEYIASYFEEYGLRPGWRHNSYLYPFETLVVRPLEQPELTHIGPDGEPVQSFGHQMDFGYVLAGHGGSGKAQAPLTFIGFDGGPDSYQWEDFRGIDLRGRIVLAVEDLAPNRFADEALIRGALGIIWLVGDDDPTGVRSEVQISEPEEPHLRTPTLPIFRVRPSTMEQILAEEELDLASMIDGNINADQEGQGWYAYHLQTQVRMSLSLGEVQQVAVPAVIGVLPGSDYELTPELVVLFTHYDGMGQEPDGSVFAGANESASGVGILLEIARLWQTEDLSPRRSVLFVAWGGGALDAPGAYEFLSGGEAFRYLPNPNMRKRMSPEAIFELAGVGAGADAIAVHNNSSQELLSILREVANDSGLEIIPESQSDMPDMVHIPRTPWVGFAWEGWQSPPNEDKLDRIDPQKLEEVGQVLSLALTRIVRETRY